MPFTIREIIDIVLMSLIVGYLLKDIFRFKAKKRTAYEPLDDLYNKKHDYSAYFFAVIVTAPAIVLHELGHKFVAMYFGYAAVFYAAYAWLGIGFLLKLLNTGILFFVPAFVSIGGGAAIPPMQQSLIAFAGPGVNLVIWLATAYLYKHHKFKENVHAILVFTAMINKFLFIFNMIPIPGFDGFQVFKGIIGMF